MRNPSKLNRRTAMFAGLAAAVALDRVSRKRSVGCELVIDEVMPPVFSLIPVVADGKWIWKDPPSETGYLEPREFELTTTIQWQGRGNAERLTAYTVAPIEHPEQELLDHSIETDGCEALFRQIDNGAGQFVAQAASIGAGQTLTAKLIQRFRLYKYYAGYERDQFPAKQVVDRLTANQYLGSSPGINLHSRGLAELSRQVTSKAAHPWDKARAFFQWSRDEIKPKLGDYSSVEAALSKREGDCEERAAVFIALCRSVGIPARLVWVPNHAWAEFGLVDESETLHWIPVHTAAYDWFGWTGAHELVLQKGDRVLIPDSKRRVRLIADRYRSQGAKPVTSITAILNPIGEEPQTAGPGARVRDEQARWHLNAQHPADKRMRE